MTLPAKDLVARNAESSQRGADEIRNDAKVFSNDFRAGCREDIQDALTKRLL